MYALSCTLWQVLTGQELYPEQENLFAIQDLVIEGKRPEHAGRPWAPANWLEEEILQMVRAGWARDPEDRPTAEHMLEELRELSERSKIRQDARDHAILHSNTAKPVGTESLSGSLNVVPAIVTQSCPLFANHVLSPDPPDVASPTSPQRFSTPLHSPSHSPSRIHAVRGTSAPSELNDSFMGMIFSPSPTAAEAPSLDASPRLIEDGSTLTRTEQRSVPTRSVTSEASIGSYGNGAVELDGVAANLTSTRD